MTMLVRLKPYNPRRGYVMRTYIDGITGASFKEERGWYEVPDDVANKLRDITSKPENPESPLAFDICTREEAIALERRMRKAAQERASATDPFSVEGASRDHLGGRTPRSPAARDSNTLTTDDLPNGQSLLKNELEDEPADESDLESDDLAADVAASQASRASKKTAAGKKNPPFTKKTPNGPPAVPGAPSSLLPPEDDEA